MRIPDWIKTGKHAEVHDTKQLLRKYGLSTVCEEARCPNRSRCFSKPTATFMILGSNCTRKCGFCSVNFADPEPVNENEPENIANAADAIGLKYVVITSVARDDLPDGGAGFFAKTITAIKKRLPYSKVEVLTPDFKGDLRSIDTVLTAQPDVFNHNVETVKRLYSAVRPQADYRCSLNVLKHARECAPDIYIKSGFMLGLGERDEEIMQLLEDLLRAGCDFITIGQYLRPTRNNLPVVEYVTPEQFEKLRLKALSIGFKHVSSGPLVRSSMNAEEIFEHV